MKQQLRLAAPYAARLEDEGADGARLCTPFLCSNSSSVVFNLSLSARRSSEDKMKQQLRLAALYAARMLVEEGADSSPFAGCQLGYQHASL